MYVLLIIIFVMGWWPGTNMDIQPVFNHYKTVAYTCDYLSKSENECSVPMKQARRVPLRKS